MQAFPFAAFAPLFFLFVLLEWYWSKQKKQDWYNFDNTILNFSCGAIERAFYLLYYYVLYLIYSFLFQEFAPFHLSVASPWTWIGAFVLIDFIYYWHHRFLHEINVLWAVHVTHHSSQHFNLSVAFRNSFLPLFLKTISWAPLPLLGFPLEVIFLAIIINGLYQFMLHTHMRIHFGFLNAILVSPLAHKLHHASNEEYLDKNYGAVFIVWDRLFGTFVKEEEDPIFGLTGKAKAVRDPDPFWVSIHYFVELWILSKREKGWKNKGKLWVQRPRKTYQRFKDNWPVLEIYTREQKPVSAWLIAYVWLQMIPLVLFLAYIYYARFVLSPGQIVLASGLIMLTAWSISMLMARRKSGYWLEGIRLASIFGFMAFGGMW